jgi:hypothetical protein
MPTAVGIAVGWESKQRTFNAAAVGLKLYVWSLRPATEPGAAGIAADVE